LNFCKSIVFYLNYLKLSCFKDEAIEKYEFLKDYLIDASTTVKRAVAINFELIDEALLPHL